MSILNEYARGYPTLRQDSTGDHACCAALGAQFRDVSILAAFHDSGKICLGTRRCPTWELADVLNDICGMHPAILERTWMRISGMRRRFAGIIRSMRPPRCALLLLIMAGALFVGSSIVLAQTEDECKKILARYERGLKKAEEWAWARISTGKIANFNGRLWAKERNPKNPKQKILDPKNPGDDKMWKQRRLSPHFLEKILTDKCLRSAIPEQGVRIRGAYFKRRIDLKGESIMNPLSIERPLLIEESFFKSGAVIHRFRTSRTVSFTDSAFKKKLSMSSVKIDDDLLLKRTLLNDRVRLEDAEIGGKLDMRRSILKDRFRMNTVSIKDDLLM